MKKATVKMKFIYKTVLWIDNTFWSSAVYAYVDKMNEFIFW